MSVNIIGIEKDDIANGPGIRVTLFVSGCRCKCKGCFNPETWDFNAGKPFNTKMMNEVLAELSKEHVKGISLSGGHPFEPENAHELALFIRRIHSFPSLRNKDVWAWSGWTYEKLLEEHNPLLYETDFLVDGPFVEELKDTSLKFRGSSNQRIIDVKQSLKEGHVITVD